MGEMKNAYEIIFGKVEREGINFWRKCWAEQTMMKDAYKDKQIVYNFRQTQQYILVSLF